MWVARAVRFRAWDTVPHSFGWKHSPSAQPGILTTHTGSLPRPPIWSRCSTPRSWARTTIDGLSGSRAARDLRHRAPTGRRRHRRRRRRRAQQGQLDGLCARAAERARGDRQPGAVSRRDARLAGLSGGLRGHARHAGGPVVRAGGETHGAPEGAGLRRADRLCRAGGIEGRYRQSQERAARRPRRGSLHDRDLAVQSRALLREPLLRLGRGVSRGAGRRHARRIQGDRRCGLSAADRRSAHGDALQSRGRRLDRGLPQVHRAARRGGQPRAARHSRKTACASTPATASTSRRACTISSSSISST